MAPPNRAQLEPGRTTLFAGYWLVKAQNAAPGQPPAGPSLSGLLEVLQDGTYRNGKVAACFLAGPGPYDLRPFLRFWDTISYPTWTRLDEALAGGPTRKIFELDDPLRSLMGNRDACDERRRESPTGCMAAQT
jgi:hypothetical protein